MTLTEALSIRVNELLKEREITQYKLYTLIGVSQSTISDIRHQNNKKVTLNIIYEIAQGFNMDLPTFFDCPLFKNWNITD